MSVYGPDVSHYQGTIDWQRLARSGEGFAFVKATQGMSVDSQFARNRAGSLLLPVRGAYHFGNFGGDPVAQAQFFVRTVGKIHAGDFLVLDAEDTGAPKGAACVSWIGTFLATVQRESGLPASRVLVYTGAWWWNPHTGGTSAFINHPLWVSGYGTKPTIPTGYKTALLWQYTNAASVPGVAGRCDRSVYSGTLAQLRARAGNPVVTAPGGGGTGVPVPPTKPGPVAIAPFHGPYRAGTRGPVITTARAALRLPPGDQWDDAFTEAYGAYLLRRVDAHGNQYLIDAGARSTYLTAQAYASICKQLPA